MSRVQVLLPLPEYKTALLNALRFVLFSAVGLILYTIKTVSEIDIADIYLAGIILVP